MNTSPHLQPPAEKECRSYYLHWPRQKDAPYTVYAAGDEPEVIEHFEAKVGRSKAWSRIVVGQAIELGIEQVERQARGESAEKKGLLFGDPAWGVNEFRLHHASVRVKEYVRRQEPRGAEPNSDWWEDNFFTRLAESEGELEAIAAADAA